MNKTWYVYTGCCLLMINRGCVKCILLASPWWATMKNTKKKSKSSRQKSQMFSFGQFCQMKTLFHENLQRTDKLWQLWLYIWLVVTVRFRIWSQHFSWRVRPVLERHSAANKEETPQQRQETRWVIACSPWAYSLWITLSNADFSFLFFLGSGMLFGRILELAQHKTSKTVWATTPWWVAESY